MKPQPGLDVEGLGLGGSVRIEPSAYGAVWAEVLWARTGAFCSFWVFDSLSVRDCSETTCDFAV